MPRDLPLGNGHVLVNFDSTYAIRDVFFPHVGSENHVAGHFCRLGVWADGAFAWSGDDGWRRDLTYEDETLVTQVRLTNEKLRVDLRISDAVDFARPVLVRRFALAPGGAADVRLFLGLDLIIYGNAYGDTAYYDPALRAVVHYKDARYFIHGGLGKDGAVDQFACGQKEFHNEVGTWRDAEDGMLSGNPIAQGSVDSVIGLHAWGDPAQERVLYAWIAIGKSLKEITDLHERVRKTPEKFLERTRNYWKLWANKEQTDFGPMPQPLIAQYKRSLLTVRTQIDDDGAILAANDSSNQDFNADTYSYVWPRDGALVAFALDEAGRHELANAFFQFCGRVIHDHGYFKHKYNPDGTLASSWHPYEYQGRPRLPIQEDETALVLWSLWHHFDRTRSIEMIRNLYAPVVIAGGTFLAQYVGPEGLCEPSWDLWEERWGIHAFTVGAVYGGLRGAANFARAFGENDDAERFDYAAIKLRSAVKTHFFDQAGQRFARMLSVADDRTLTPDWTQDAAIFGLFSFGLLDLSDPEYEQAAKKVFDSVEVHTPVGGWARYVGDTYYRGAGLGTNVPGNPWFIPTLWKARYVIARAKNVSELEEALPILKWVVDHALPSGILSEQIDPDSGEPLSVSPLTWSHADYVSTFLGYLDKFSTLQLCPTCHRPIYMREHARLHQDHLDSAGLTITK